MVEENFKKNVRSDLMCLSIGRVKDMLEHLSSQQGIGSSGYIRQMIIKEFKRERRKESTPVG